MCIITSKNPLSIFKRCARKNNGNASRAKGCTNMLISDVKFGSETLFFDPICFCHELTMQNITFKGKLFWQIVG